MTTTTHHHRSVVEKNLFLPPPSSLPPPTSHLPLDEIQQFTEFIERQNPYLFLLRMLSACGDLMYSSTITFHRWRHSQPRKNPWTLRIFFKSSSSTFPANPAHPPWAPPSDPWRLSSCPMPDPPMPDPLLAPPTPPPPYAPRSALGVNRHSFLSVHNCVNAHYFRIQNA